MRWPSVAKVLKSQFVEEKAGAYICRVCKKEISKIGDNPIIELRNIYKHFEKEHRDIIDKIRQEAKERKPAPFLIDVIFKARTPFSTAPATTEEKAEEEKEEEKSPEVEIETVEEEEKE